jgi:hypothetical protein
MLIGAIDEGLTDSAGIDAGAMLSEAVVVGAIDAPELAVIEGAALGSDPPPGVLVAAGELVLPLLHAEATNRPTRPSAPTEVNFIQGLLRNHGGSAQRLCAHRPMRRDLRTGSLGSVTNPLRRRNR